MASMDSIYGGNSLKAEDLPLNFRGVVTVESIEPREVRQDDGSMKNMLSARFVGKEKGLLLNVTNANMLAEIAQSRDYDYWPGKRVMLVRTTTDYGGKRVPCIRLDHVSAPQARPVPPFVPPPPPVYVPPPTQSDYDDSAPVADGDVPFSVAALVPLLGALMASVAVLA